MDQGRPHICSPGSPTNASSFQCSQGWGFAEQSLPGLTNNSALESAGSVCFQSQTSEGGVSGWPAFFFFFFFTPISHLPSAPESLSLFGRHHLHSEGRLLGDSNSSYEIQNPACILNVASHWLASP